MPARRTVAKTDDAFLASLSPNAPAMKKGSKTIFDTARRIIGSVQPNLDGDGTDESDDDEQAPLAIAVVPSPTQGTKSAKVRYQPTPRACQRPPRSPVKKVSLTLNSPQTFRNPYPSKVALEKKR